jgi:hypothetical protein
MSGAQNPKDRRSATKHTERYLRNGDHTDLADVRFARPNIRIYDAHVAYLYQWVCAQYLVGVKGAETKAMAERVSVNHH